MFLKRWYITESILTPFPSEVLGGKITEDLLYRLENYPILRLPFENRRYYSEVDYILFSLSSTRQETWPLSRTSQIES